MADLIRGKSGQAAVTDALFLLVIITGLMAFLFSFSINYGKGLSDQVNRNTNYEFVASALKTIMYQSVSRNADVPLNPTNPNLEIDYLMAQVKEDFADDKNLSPNTQKNLAKTVFDVMRPVADSEDYLLYINTAQKYVFVMIWRTEFAPVQFGPDGKPVRFQDVTVLNPSHKMYFCNPDISSDAVTRLKLRVGNTTEVQAIVNMVESAGSAVSLSQDTETTRAGVSLSTWVATRIPDAEWAALQCVPTAVQFV